MFNFKKRTITLCVDDKYIIDMERFIKSYVDVYGVVDNYVADGKVYISFETKLTQKEMCKQIEKTLYRSKTRIIGCLIFIEMGIY